MTTRLQDCESAVMTAFAERPIGPGITRQLLASGASGELVRLRFTRGASRPPQNVARQLSLLVQSGRFQIWIGEDMLELAAGGTAIVPADAVHACLCLDQGVLIEVS